MAVTPDRADAAQLTGVRPHLVGVAHAHADQLEGGMADDLGDHHLPDEAGAPDDDPLGFGAHRIISPELTIRCCPVTALAWSEAKNTATSATSPSSVIRRSGNVAHDVLEHLLGCDALAWPPSR